MNANDFADWCKYAGIYPANVSNGDEFRSYAAKLSSAGSCVMVVHTFLRQNREGVNVAQWRNFYVAGSQPDVKVQLERTTAALNEIGATRAADLVANSSDTSAFGQLQQLFNRPTGEDGPSLEDIASSVNPADLMGELRQSLASMLPDEAAAAGITPRESPKPASENCESFEEIEALLQKYVDQHADDLNADVQQYGDVRSQADFDPAQREEELRRQRTRELMVEQEQEDAAKISRLIAEFRSKLAKNPAARPNDFQRLRRSLHELYARYRDRGDTLQAPALVESMNEAKELFQRHESLLIFQPIENDDLLRRMRAIGEYDCDDEFDQISITWRNPRGLNAAFKPLALRLVTQSPDDEHFEALLTAAEFACENAGSISDQIRVDLIARFREFEEFDQDWLLEDYPRDENGVIPESAILAEAGGGTIEFESTGEGNSKFATVWMPVDWDDEHGFETRIELSN